MTVATSTVPASAGLKAEVDLSDQVLRVYINDVLEHEWKVSTARRGYVTPVGTYTPYWLDRNHRSRKYGWAPMPYSVFFHGGYAIHGTTEVKDLGRPASHGCVRLHPDNAAILFKLVSEYGKQNTSIIVVH